MSNDYGIKFTIPDKPPEEQLEIAKNIREIMISFAKLSGELDTLDLTPVDKAIAKLEKKINPKPPKGGSGR